MRRAPEPQGRWLPEGHSVDLDVEDIQRLRLERLPGLENPDLGPLNEIRVVRVHPELDR